MFSKGYNSVTKQDVLDKVSELQILNYYFNIDKIPTLINSPLREDKNASFGIFSPNGTDIFFKDFGRPSDKGSIFTLLHKLWDLSYDEVYLKIIKEVGNCNPAIIKTCRVFSTLKHKSTINSIDVKIRKWKDYDLQWWGQYGITKKWLCHAEVYPVSLIIRKYSNKRYIIPADKLAYVYIERKEGKITKKIYQPLNTSGHKWCQDNDKSVLGLWRLLPERGDIVFICSSVKDSLTLMANCNIPAICMQGEGYSISSTVVKQLKERFNKVYICLDNDTAGIEDAAKLEKTTGFKNIILPKFDGGKDIADYRKLYGKESFVKLINKLLEKALS